MHVPAPNSLMSLSSEGISVCESGEYSRSANPGPPFPIPRGRRTIIRDATTRLTPTIRALAVEKRGALEGCAGGELTGEPAGPEGGSCSEFINEL